MTKLMIEFEGRRWTLTDEASQSSYGEPVLVSDDGVQLRACEIAIAETMSETFGRFPPVTAYEIACRGCRNNGEDISSEDWLDVEAMLHRYATQWRQGGGYSPNGVGLVVGGPGK